MPFVAWPAVCGRYTLTTRKSDEIQARLLETLGLEAPPPDSGFERFNVAPSQKVLGVVDDRDGRRMEELRWGLVPHWAKELNTRFSMINARGETLDQRPAYRRLVARAGNRCLLLADGWYEWQRPEDPRQPKRPLHFSLADGGPSASPVSGLAGARRTVRWFRVARSSPARRTSWSGRSTTACRSSSPTLSSGRPGCTPRSTARPRASCSRRYPGTEWWFGQRAQW
jgi:SOS response associated peptidase (SRAP)